MEHQLVSTALKIDLERPLIYPKAYESISVIDSRCNVLTIDLRRVLRLPLDLLRAPFLQPDESGDKRFRSHDFGGYPLYNVEHFRSELSENNVVAQGGVFVPVKRK